MLNFSYKWISTYRTQLMGAAILWVVFFHSTINAAGIPVIGTIQSLGYGGVDIFLLLSGLGLYYACKKDRSIAVFYKRRVLRVIPTYLTVVLVTCLLRWYLGEMTLVDVVLNLTTLSFWLNTNPMFDWYIPALLLLYLVTPWFMRLVQSRNPYAVVATTALAGLVLSIIITYTPLSYLHIFVIRIPVFVTGFLVGYWIERDRKVSMPEMIVGTAAALVGLGFVVLGTRLLSYETMWNYGLFWYPFILITLPLCTLAAGTLHIGSRPGRSRWMFLTFCGTHSLEIYLLHERILGFTDGLAGKLHLDNLVYNGLCIILTLVLAYVLKRAVNLFSGRISKISQSPKAA